MLHKAFISLILTLGITERVICNPISSSSVALVKRESPNVLQFINANKKPDGDQDQKQNAATGDVLTVNASCGTITAKLLNANDATCNFFLPTNLVAGTTYTGTPAAGFFQITVPGACAGGEVGLFQLCDSCTTFGENFNGLDCQGKAGGGKDNVNLCIQSDGTTLAQC